MHAARIMMFVLAVSLVGACSLKARSNSYRCDTPTDCEPGRSCQDGWCVTQVTLIDAPVASDGPGNPLIDASPIDASPIDASPIDASPIDASPVDASPVDAASQCPAPCTSCVGLTCIVECPGVGDCANLACPAGWACEVHCDGDNACAAGIDCTLATSCDLSCTGPSSCQGAVVCGAGACNISCAGTGSCTGGIDCVNSCACDTTCGGAGSCTTPPDCPGPNPCTMGNGMCTSNGGPCGSC